MNLVKQVLDLAREVKKTEEALETAVSLQAKGKIFPSTVDTYAEEYTEAYASYCQWNSFLAKNLHDEACLFKTKEGINPSA